MPASSSSSSESTVIVRTTASKSEVRIAHDQHPEEGEDVLPSNPRGFFADQFEVSTLYSARSRSRRNLEKSGACVGCSKMADQCSEISDSTVCRTEVTTMHTLRARDLRSGDRLAERWTRSSLGRVCKTLHLHNWHFYTLHPSLV